MKSDARFYDISGVGKLPSVTTILSVISRAASDSFALRSQRHYAAALSAGFYEPEMMPIDLPGKRPDGSASIFSADEHPRPQSDEAGLARLKPLQAGGWVVVSRWFASRWCCGGLEVDCDRLKNIHSEG